MHGTLSHIICSFKFSALDLKITVYSSYKYCLLSCLSPSDANYIADISCCSYTLLADSFYLTDSFVDWRKVRLAAIRLHPLWLMEASSATLSVAVLSVRRCVLEPKHRRWQREHFPNLWTFANNRICRQRWHLPTSALALLLPPC